jgi:hypothetical protein
MTTGFSFQVQKGNNYIVRFLAAGETTKLVSMIVSSPMHISEDVATKEHIENAQEKVEKIGNELKVWMSACRQC